MGSETVGGGALPNPQPFTYPRRTSSPFSRKTRSWDSGLGGQRRVFRFSRRARQEEARGAQDGALQGGENTSLLCLRRQLKFRAACSREDAPELGLGENGTHAPCHPQLHVCYQGTHTYRIPAGITISGREDVAHCQTQILVNTWVIVRDWGE